MQVPAAREEREGVRRTAAPSGVTWYCVFSSKVSLKMTALHPPGRASVSTDGVHCQDSSRIPRPEAPRNQV